MKDRHYELYPPVVSLFLKTYFKCIYTIFFRQPPISIVPNCPRSRSQRGANPMSNRETGIQEVGDAACVLHYTLLTLNHERKV